MASSILIFALVTVGLLLLFQLVASFTNRNRSQLRRRIKEAFQRDAHDGSAASPLYKDLDVMSMSSAEEYALLSAGDRPGPKPSTPGLRKRLESLLQRAHVPLQVGHLVLLMAASALLLGLLGGWLLRWPGGMTGAMVGFAVPIMLIQWKSRRWRQKLLRQLPSAFEVMSRVIRSGQTVGQAFQVVGEAFEEPLASEFSSCQQMQDLGLSPDVVLKEMSKRADVLEFRIFVLAMTVQREVGGNLSELLERLAGLIRSRLRLQRQVRSLTAEGRLQGLTLLVLPSVVFAAMFLINRPYAQSLLEHPGLLGLTAVFLMVGVIWIRRIVDFGI